MSFLDHLQVFSRVAELSSFTQAADSLGLPKASVSSAVQQLENRHSPRQVIHHPPSTRHLLMNMKLRIFTLMQPLTNIMDQYAEDVTDLEVHYLSRKKNKKKKKQKN